MKKLDMLWAALNDWEQSRREGHPSDVIACANTLADMLLVRAPELLAVARAARTVILAKDNGHTTVEMVASQALRGALARLESCQ